MFNSKKPGAEAACTSIVARGMTVEGDIHFSGNLHLEGTVHGLISADADGDALFTLGPQGQVRGEVCVPTAVIDGLVEGNVRCSKRLELTAGARVEGDIQYKTLEMAAGASVNGRMQHQPGELPRLTAQGNAEDDEPLSGEEPATGTA